MLWTDGRLSGYLAYNGNLFALSNIGGDIHVMAETDVAKLPPDHPPTPPGKSADAVPVDRSTITRPPSREPDVTPFSEAERKALEAKKFTIDVMILYTKYAASHYIRHPADIWLSRSRKLTNFSETAALATSPCGSCIVRRLTMMVEVTIISPTCTAWSMAWVPLRK